MNLPRCKLEEVGPYSNNSFKTNKPGNGSISTLILALGGRNR